MIAKDIDIGVFTQDSRNVLCPRSWFGKFLGLLDRHTAKWAVIRYRVSTRISA